MGKKFILGLWGCLPLLGACDEHRCEEGDSSLLDDTEPNRTCSGDRIIFNPSSVTFQHSNEGSNINDSSSATGGMGGTFVVTEDDRQDVTLTVESSRGQRRDRAVVDVFLSDRSCGGQRPPTGSGVSPVRLEAKDGCTSQGQGLLECTTNPYGKAFFSLQRNPDVETGTGYVCASGGENSQSLRVTVSTALPDDLTASIEDIPIEKPSRWLSSCGLAECQSRFPTLTRRVSFEHEDDGATTTFRLPPEQGLARITVTSESGRVGIAQSDRGLGCPNNTATQDPVTSTILNLASTDGAITLCREALESEDRVRLSVVLLDRPQVGDDVEITVYPETVIANLSNDSASEYAVGFTTCAGAPYPALTEEALDSLKDQPLTFVDAQGVPSPSVPIDLQTTSIESPPKATGYRLSNSTTTCALPAAGGDGMGGSN